MENKNSFHLSVKTPDSLAYEAEVKSLMIDTEEGRMLVLPHHASLLGSINFSNIFISEGERVYEFSVRNGFLSVKNETNSVDVLCISCEKIQTVKYTSVENYLKFLEGELQKEKLNQYQLEFLESEKFAIVKQLKTMKKD